MVKEDEFWRNYFYRVNLIKQSFDLQVWILFSRLKTSETTLRTICLTISLKDLEAREEEANLKRGQQAEAAESRLQPPADEDLNKENARWECQKAFNDICGWKL